MTPTPDWARCHVEIYEAPGWLDDCFRTGWSLFQSAAAQSFANAGDISGDYATMTVTEGAAPSGCGYLKDISAKGISTNAHPLMRVRLRGRGTTPQHRVLVEYVNAATTDSGWINAPTDFDTATLALASGKTVKYVKLYAKCNTGSGTAYVDYDYAAIIGNPPLIPNEVEEVDVDLQTTRGVSGFHLILLNDPLTGVMARRYSLDEGFGSKAYDLGLNRGHGTVVNATWTTGKHLGGLYFNGATSDRLDTGFKTTIGAGGTLTISFWVKAAPGATGVICGFGKAIGADWNRVQFNFSGDKVRLYVKDDTANTLQYTSAKTVADDTWHLVTGVVDPGSDKLELYIDGDYDGGASGALGIITLDAWDLTWGCLHNELGYTSFATTYVDEPRVYSRALTAEEIRNALFLANPPSGAARAGVGNIVMIYLAAATESLVHKIIAGRVMDRQTSGEPDNPKIELIGEDLGEILHERTFTQEYASATQISTIAGDICDSSAPEIERDIDATNRTLTNHFRDETVWSLLQKLAESATFASGENGANFYVDPGGSLRYKKYGAFSCPEAVSDSSDGNSANILDISVKETIKGDPRLVNDVKVIVFEEETTPRDEDAWTESAESWSSPDPTDSGYPLSDAGDKKSGTASIHFNTTNCGSQYRMKYTFSEVDIAGVDQVRFWFKYGAGLSPENLEVSLQKGDWIWTWDYRIKSGITPPPAVTWGEIAVNITDMAVTGNPGNVVDRIQIRAYRASGNLGTSGFLVDKLRFVRNEKAATAEDSTSQACYGRRTFREVDKTLTDLDFAGYVAANILAHRKDPLVIVQASVPGRGQLGFRPPQIVTLTSLKDALSQRQFQIQRARHHYTPEGGYVCELELVAARKPDGTYEPKLAPASTDLGATIAELKQRQWDGQLNALRSAWE
jgi:hypothetical protein